MKLKNKKTGEIGYLRSTNWNEIALIIMDKNGVQLGKYTSLAELVHEWEDVEEPKSFWTINTTFDCAEPIVSVEEIDARYYNDENAKSIGNYFETEEEAKQAVEKLKAWKRLKDKGFRFEGINEVDGSIKTGLSKGVSLNDCEEFYEDMNLLFGGEE